jgi:predicted transcriptional regulator
MPVRATETVNLPPEVGEKLNQLARSTGRSKNKIMAEAITEKVECLWSELQLSPAGTSPPVIQQEKRPINE